MPSIRVHDSVAPDPSLMQSDNVLGNDDKSTSRVRKRTISHRVDPGPDESSFPIFHLSDGMTQASIGENDAPVGENRGQISEKNQSTTLFEKEMARFFKKYENQIRMMFGILVLIGYHIYFAFAIAYNFQKALALVVLTTVVWIGAIYYFLFKPRLGQTVYTRCYEPVEKCLIRIFRSVYAKLGICLVVIAAISVFVAIDTANDRYRLVSLGGLTFYIFLLLIMSKHPSKINWRPVLWGLLLQFLMGLIVLRWSAGSAAFGWMSTQFSTFLGYTRNGTSFVYGFLAVPPPICGMDPVFAFSTLQTVFFFGAVVSILYYLGIMQFVIKQIAWFMTCTMGTTAVESLNAAANIFLGQTDAPLLIRPYISRMTDSEIFAAMTGGFATVSGSVFATYVTFGACPKYLLSGSVMSATGSLAVSKMFYPETEQSKCKNIDDLKMEKGKETNILEAISAGASNGIYLVANVIANLLVFLALLAFFDNVLVWLGDMVGIEGLTFEKLCSYLFFPLAYIMGVGENTEDVMRVAELMGIKTFLNEFIAYQKMGDYIRQGLLTPRAQVIATYALCGFSNLGSIGIQLGGFSAMCPEKKATFAKIVLRACVAGSITTFMTACIAGLLTAEPLFCEPASLGTNCTCLGNYGGCNGTKIM